MKLCCRICGLILLFLAACSSKCKSQNWLLEQLLPNNYDNKEVPINRNEFPNATLPVNATINISSFQVSEAERTVTASLTMCLQWRDYRFSKLASITFPGESTPNDTVHFIKIRVTKIDQLWLPNLYFRNSIQASVVNALEKVQYATIWPTSQIVHYCSKMSATFTCPISLSNYPFDESHCKFEVENLSRSTEFLTVKLVKFKSPEGNARYRVKNTYNGTCQPVILDPFERSNQSSPRSGQSCAYVTLHLIRRVNYYVIRYYAPTFLIVVCSFGSFWLPTNAWPARVIYTCTVLITMITSSTTAYKDVPAAGVVSLYWWMWGCQMFIYLALIEFAIALAWVQFVGDKKIAHATNQESPDGHYFGKNNWYAATGRVIERCLHKIYGPIDFFGDPVNRSKVDYVARIVFPFMWLLFVIVYLLATVPRWSERYRYHSNETP